MTLAGAGKVFGVFLIVLIVGLLTQNLIAAGAALVFSIAIVGEIPSRG